jgi:hypothetical protein
MLLKENKNMSDSTENNNPVDCEERIYDWFWGYANKRGIKQIDPAPKRGKTIFFSTSNLERVFGSVNPSESPRKIKNVALYQFSLGGQDESCNIHLCLTVKPGVTSDEEILKRENTLKEHTGIIKEFFNNKNGTVRPNVYSLVLKSNAYSPDAFSKEDLTESTIEKMIAALVEQDHKWFGGKADTVTSTENSQACAGVTPHYLRAVFADDDNPIPSLTISLPSWAKEYHAGLLKPFYDHLCEVESQEPYPDIKGMETTLHFEISMDTDIKIETYRDALSYTHIFGLITALKTALETTHVPLEVITIDLPDLNELGTFQSK